ncbi:2Fe-2S iron-sulfur cluster-binding protein [Thiohalorhabdus sp. Cl-TMA]|uniref:2Fe-2S iron-sulfur cluster-binding protein n=1 Tax=Thiohalorhabdus methylotrophus TaxID=3242694 RepID=A0ABV4TTV4_9GAMM
MLRLSRKPREWLDRTRTVRFTLEGRTYRAHPGDTVTSALWANGVRVLGRSFKYHRPRGVLSAANHDVNALYQNAGATHIRADVTPVREGMVLEPVNVGGSLASDRNRILDRLGRFLPVGFYYKSLHRPKWLFPFWERLIRGKAGLGEVDTGWPADRAPKAHAFCEVLVVGAGPAGLAAALHAGDAGAEVLLVDENPHVGGSLDYEWVGTTVADRERARLVERVSAHPRVTVRTSSVALGHYADHQVPVAGPEGISKVRAEAVVLATGVLEQPAVFRNNDLPGVMLASGGMLLLHRFGVAPGLRPVLLVANAEGYRAALALIAAGLPPEAVLDWRVCGEPERGLPKTLQNFGVEVREGWTVREAHGREALAGVTAVPANRAGAPGARQGVRIDCDALLMSVGWAPAGHLLYQAGGTFSYDHSLHQPVPHRTPHGVYPAGRLNGVFVLSEQLADGRHAAERALAARTGAPDPGVSPYRAAEPHSHPWPIVPHRRGRDFVDFDEDLQLKDLEQAAAEGFDNIELLKRFSTVGMGPSQGKHANMNAIRILARWRGQGIDETGTTTARPVYHPVPLGHVAGRRLRPWCTGPFQAFHEAQGAAFMEAGPWLRPDFYGPRKAEAVAAEVAAVRQGVGLMDLSPLGKIEVLGPDAARLLESAYTSRLADLRSGRSRYAVLTDETGVVLDDGVVGRLAADRFYVTATTSHAEATTKLLLRHAAERGLDAHVVPRTGQLAALSVAGPGSRELLQPFTDLPLHEPDFPRQGIAEARVAGHAAHLLRSGFVGEVAFEVHLAPEAARTVWMALWRAGGEAGGIRAFGVQAQRVLRLEKGHLLVGQDTDGLTTPFEAGLGGLVHLDKPAFTGRESLALLKERRERRLVGFTLPPDAPLPEECHLVIVDGAIAGRVTSIAFSPTLGHPIGLAMVDAELADSGAPLPIRLDDGGLVTARPAPKTFYDPQGRCLGAHAEEAC